MHTGNLHRPRPPPRVQDLLIDTISQIVVAAGVAAGWCATLFAGHGSALAAWEERMRPAAERKRRLDRRAKGLYAPRGHFRLWLRDLTLRTAAHPLVGCPLRRRLRLHT